MKNYEFVAKSDLPIFGASWFFHLGSIYVEEGLEKNLATFDLFVRDLPSNRNYLVASGLNSVVDFLLKLKFTREQINFFKTYLDLPPKTIAYYKTLRFTGDLWAIPESTLVFPNEPVLRITAPIVEAEIIERYLINTVMSNMVLASKISRFVNAVKAYNPKIITALNYTRAHGVQASLIAIRNAKMVGLDVITSPFQALAEKKKLKSVATTHAFISSFADESQALRSFCRHLKDNVGYWLVDTYDVKAGLKKFIKIVKENKRRGLTYPIYINLDSGDLAEQSRWARKTLDRAGLKEIKILVHSNLDEYKIARLRPGEMICDLMMAGTELTSSSDTPKLEVVYKLCQLEKNGRAIPKMKLSSKKLTLPGKKQVFRVSQKGKYHHDVIGLAGEKIKNGRPLLKPYILGGKLKEKLPPAEQLRAWHEKDKSNFPKNLFLINKKTGYPVKISRRLNDLMIKTRKAVA